jgi:LmbE family N-acetylglucosaminyl deacetylase
LKTILKNIIVELLFFSIKLFGKKADSLIFDRILVIAPHPDDEILGLGGSMLKMIEAGTKVYVLYLTDGENSGVWPDKEEIKLQRILLSQKVCTRIGIDNSNITRLHLPDGNVPNYTGIGFNEVVKPIREIIETIKPNAVFVTHPLEYWPFDHVVAAEIACEAVKLSQTKPQLLYYWVWAWYNLRPWNLSLYKLERLRGIDINVQLARKMELMNIYLDSCNHDGKPWSGVLPESLRSVWRRPMEVLEQVL